MRHVAARASWVEADAGRSALDQLVYRSRLLGAELAIVNWKGGNTSSKTTEVDHTGARRRVLWVKGSGSDLATITSREFVGLRLDEVLPLLDREAMPDEAMVDYLLRCVLHPQMPRPSIETLLHAFLPFLHVDHTHPDAVLAFCTSAQGEVLTKTAFGNRVMWIPYQRPGFALSKAVILAVRENPQAEAVYLAKHGLVTWGDSGRQCYEATLRAVEQAEAVIASGSSGRAVVSLSVPPVEPQRRDRLLGQLLPALRGAVSRGSRKILHVDASDEVLQFVGAAEALRLSQVGSACPDHLVHTKHLPLFVPFDAAHQDMADLMQRLHESCASYEAAYRQYVHAHRRPEDPVGDAAPRIVLIPGLGLVATGKDKFLATQAAGLYRRAIAVMRGASTLDRFESLSPKDAYDVEYWPLERYKLTLTSPDRELASRVALVTGAAGGIGRAIATRLAEEGAHVVLADLDLPGAQEVAADLTQRVGAGRALAVCCDVTDETSVIEAFQTTVLTYGGVDIVVSNAGVALAAPLEATTVAQWRHLHEVLVTGYFLVSQQAVRMMKTQGLGGAIIFIVSKNALVPSKEASAYNAAKAAELHLARTVAEEVGPFGIRVNSVCPDAVLEGSRIWTTQWREERARAYGVRSDQLEEFYRQRTTLKVSVQPQDVAEAVLFLASDRAAKTTGAIVTVDGGVPGAYVR